MELHCCQLLVTVLVVVLVPVLLCKKSVVIVLTSTVSCAYDSKLTIYASFSPKPNNFFTIFQATDHDGG